MGIWKDIKGFEGMYQASTCGHIRNSRTGHIMSPCLNRKGYPQTSLWKNKKGHSKTIHRHVAETFIPNPENKPQVNHIDGNKLNNNIDNLEWNTSNENIQHAYDNGLILKPTGTRNGRCTIKKEDALKIKRLLLEDYKHQEIADIIGTTKHVVSNIKKGRSWAHLEEEL